jgi:hypothetical protein
MFAKLSNIRIGTKLAAISVISILMVGLLAGDQMWGNAKVKNAIGAAKQEQQTAHDVGCRAADADSRP